MALTTSLGFSDPIDYGGAAVPTCDPLEVFVMPVLGKQPALTPKYLNARDAAQVYGVHRDFFRKTPELRRHRIALSARTHLYPVVALDKFFADLRAAA